jgi:hypothetical protein
LLLSWSKAKAVDLLKLACSIKILSRDRAVAFAAANPASRLKQTKAEPGRTSGSLANQRKNLVIDLPAQSLASLLDKDGEFLEGVELKAQDELHPISERLQQAVFVGRGEEQRETGNWNARRCPA